jgi:hypothetical protein
MRVNTKRTLSRKRFWSDLDVSELRSALKGGRSLQMIATDLSRDIDEVEAKLAELSGREYRIRATDAAVQSSGETDGVGPETD